ncbi:MAG: CBS domain-containing protein [Desulfobulbaceae bacterium]|nr:CBS domain-containing protein [Desulfobulbaceae bacterium]
MHTAKEIMTRKIITVELDLAVSELADLFWENRIGGAPVVDESGKLLGIVTESDLIDQSKKVHIPTIMTILDSMIFLENPAKLDKEMKKMTGTKVKDIYSNEVVTVNEDTPMSELATIMADRRMHTLPVVKDEKIVGVIGKADIIRNLYKQS